MPHVVAVALDRRGAGSAAPTCLLESDDELLQERELLLQLRVLAARARSTCLCSVSCDAARHRELAFERRVRWRAASNASRPQLRASASSVASRASISLRLKPPKIWPKSKPHHHMPAMMRDERDAGSRPRPHHGRCVRTAIRGARDAEVLAHAAPPDGRGHGRRSYGSTGAAVEAGGLGQAEHQVHVLHRLAGGALDQVVLDRRAPSTHVAVAAGGARRCARRSTRARSACPARSPAASRRRTARRRSASRTAPAGRRRCLRQPRVQRRVDAADHRQQVRREHQLDRRLAARGRVPARSPDDGGGRSRRRP